MILKQFLILSPICTQKANNWVFFISDLQIWYLTKSSQASEEKFKPSGAEFSRAILQTRCLPHSASH